MGVTGASGRGVGWELGWRGGAGVGEGEWGWELGWRGGGSPNERGGGQGGQGGQNPRARASMGPGPLDPRPLLVIRHAPQAWSIMNGLVAN